MGFDLFSRVKKSLDDYQEKKDNERAEEESRREDIAAGCFSSLKNGLNLELGEEAYAEFGARRMAKVAKTTSKTQKKGVVGRAVVGGVLLGPLGALGGAATAGSKTTENKIQQLSLIDNGKMVLTNKRFLFVGSSNVVSIPYDQALEVKFTSTMLATTLLVRYSEMLNGEHFVLSGKDSKIAELYYQGIQKRARGK